MWGTYYGNLGADYTTASWLAVIGMSCTVKWFHRTMSKDAPTLGRKHACLATWGSASSRGGRPKWKIARSSVVEMRSDAESAIKLAIRGMSSDTVFSRLFWRISPESRWSTMFSLGDLYGIHNGFRSMLQR